MPFRLIKTYNAAESTETGGSIQNATLVLWLEISLSIAGAALSASVTRLPNFLIIAGGDL